MYELYQQYCHHLQDTGKYRQLPEVSLPTFNKLSKVLDFSTNDYLGLRYNESVLKAAYEAGLRYGVGASGSRLLSGNTAIHEALEAQIAQDKKTQAALIFNSGFQANVTVLSSLLDPKVLKDRALVFFDKLNHASLYQAVFLSGAQLIRYHHNNMDDLDKKLAHYQNDPRPKFIVSETIFGMDGDVLFIEKIRLLTQRYNAFLYLDEAHATGMMGLKGYGVSTLIDLKSVKHCVMGTFSKALGASGAYVACSLAIKNYLINKAAGFIYSTALSPLMVGAAYQAWKIVALKDRQRVYLKQLSNYLRENLIKRGFNTGYSTTSIVPIWIGQESRVIELKAQLYDQGIKVSAIRPPTVPPGSARLRLALTVEHTQEDINRFITILEQLTLCP